ncbi:MAG TPA: exodeoxyribonuclease III [Burkholderiales bacterium]|nr:exodeoxyribonuclease III [Burkholderiales bacterium]
MKIATWNVNGIRARAAQFCDWVAAEQPDVICLQELKAEPGQVPEACRLVDYHAFWHGMRAYSGVSLHIRKQGSSETPKYSHPDFDLEARIVQAELGNLVLASVYVPNGNKNYPAKVEFMKRLAAWARAVRQGGRELVLCGDINITRTEMDVHPRERKPGIIGQLPEERALFAELLDGGLVDVHRRFEPGNPNVFTWWAPWRNMRSRNIGWRLDYILASPAVADAAQSCKVFPEVGTSDHAPVVMTSASG